MPTATTVLRQGFRRGDRVLRTAMVAVTDPESPAPAGDDAARPTPDAPATDCPQGARPTGSPTVTGSTPERGAR